MPLTELKIGHNPAAPPMALHRKKELYDKNSWMAKSAPERTFAVSSLRLEGAHPLQQLRMTSPHFNSGQPLPTSPHPRWFKSHATSFAQYGIYPGQGVQGLYMRDQHTGVWHKDTPARLYNREVMPPIPSPVSKSSKDMMTMNSLSINIKRQPF
eukprot:TRINITY_DN109837_c0_g1_i1.p1 TRINITY_DN109837_c0_g1~~TRINITY_DN109837_c0_g1_i1.p1  ORF type:complete len:180 (-),score=34.58 TRINITY_DN109837_c0_g1_i1:48-509(-)